MRAVLTLFLTVVLVTSMAAMPLAAAGESPAPTVETDDVDYVGDDDDPSTEGTIGYVEGYAYDDELPVDDRDDAFVDEDELDAVVYRSMARVEVIRELPFREPVDVEVITREEFQDELDELMAVGERDRLVENVRHEALFLVDRDTDAFEEFETLHGAAVGGYYDPETDEAVIVADDPERPEVDETVLGHELLHALQDQYFDLQSYERATFDQDAAKNGLIEGDAVAVDTEYDQRCGVEWDCLEPTGQSGFDDEINWGMYFGLIQPYLDGPEYVDHFHEEDGWEAVNERYDDPPASASEIIRPGEQREPVDVGLEDRSNEDWTILEPDDGTVRQTYGEVGMVAMFAPDAPRDDAPSVIEFEEFVTAGQQFDYDQPYTDGWAGDELLAYATEAERIEETGYVWQTEWQSEAEAEAFLEGYLEQLVIYGAETVDDRQDTVVIEDDYPGAYYVEHDDETVTIVRAPTVDELPEIRDGAAPEGEDTLAFDLDAWTGDEDDIDHGDYGDDDRGSIVGIGVAAAVVATLIAVVAVRRR